MVTLFKDSLMGFAWLGAAGVFLLSACQLFSLIRRNSSED